MCAPDPATPSGLERYSAMAAGLCLETIPGTTSGYAPPPSTLISGLLRGFLTEADADGIVLPAGLGVAPCHRSCRGVPAAVPRMMALGSTSSTAFRVGGSTSTSTRPRCPTPGLDRRLGSFRLPESGRLEDLPRSRDSRHRGVAGTRLPDGAAVASAPPAARPESRRWMR